MTNYSFNPEDKHLLSKRAKISKEHRNKQLLCRHMNTDKITVDSELLHKGFIRSYCKDCGMQTKVREI